MDFTLDIRTSSNNGLLSLPDAKILPVQSPSDVINLMLLGEKHRASGSTAMNHRSSRSHRLAQELSERYYIVIPAFFGKFIICHDWCSLAVS